MSSTNSSELAEREHRATQGIIQFAEEMQAIRDSKLYPNAGEKDAWKTYCKERWGKTPQSVGQDITALPVLRRASESGAFIPPVTSAAAIASLSKDVQDAILAGNPKRDDVKERAKAARNANKNAKREGREATDAEQIKAVRKVKPKRGNKIKLLVNKGNSEIDIEAVKESLNRNDNLPNQIAVNAVELRDLLEQVPAWMAEYGDNFIDDDSPETQGDIMRHTIEEEGDLTSMAFHQAKGKGADTAEDAADWLRRKESR